jgi:hypothetical protein
MGGTQEPIHPKTGIDTMEGALPRSDSRPCGARPAGTEPRSGASHELSEPAQGYRRDKELRLPAGRHHRRSMKKKGGGVAAPNGLELSRSATRASCLYSRASPLARNDCTFARQPSRLQRVVRRRDPSPRQHARTTRAYGSRNRRCASSSMAPMSSGVPRAGGCPGDRTRLVGRIPPRKAARFRKG